MLHGAPAVHPRPRAPRRPRPRPGVPARPTREIDERHAAGPRAHVPGVLRARRLLEDDARREDLLASELPDEPWFGRALRGYFPPRSSSATATGSTTTRCAARSSTTTVVNDLVNRGGITFVVPGRGGDRRRRPSRSRAPTPSCARSSGSSASGRASRRSTRSSRPARRPRCTSRPAGCSTAPRAGCCRPAAPRSTCAAEIEHFAAGRGAHAAGPRLPARRRAGAAASAARPSSRASARPPTSPADAAAMLDAFSLLDVVEIADATGEPPETVGQALLRAVRAVRRRPDAHPDHRCCRATTAGRRWPGWRCATTSTPRSPR